jgi:citrate synthase
MIKTEIGYTTVERITVRGHNLAEELIGKIDFVDMIVLTSLGRKCSPQEKDMINAILVMTCDHGLTPSALAARLTYTGAPEALQGAVAAGLLGAGSVFLGSQQNAAEMLAEVVKRLPEKPTDADYAQVAEKFVTERRKERKQLFGFGHNLHIDGDPRIPTMHAISARNGFAGTHWKMLYALEVAISKVYGRRLPINAAGAVGAMITDMQLPLPLSRGLSLVARCAGLVAHLLEEMQHPTGQELWHLVLEQDSRNDVPRSATQHKKAREV